MASLPQSIFGSGTIWSADDGRTPTAGGDWMEAADAAFLYGPVTTGIDRCQRGDTAPPRDARDNRNLYVAGLPSSVDDRALTNLMERFGVVDSAKVMLDVTTGASRGYGFVLFVEPSSCIGAIKELHKSVVQFGDMSCALQVAPAQHDGSLAAAESATVFIRNIPCHIDGASLEQFCSKFGVVLTVDMSVVSAVPVMRKACVDFDSVESARRCIDACHGRMPFDHCTIPVLAKFADSSDVRKQRKAKKQQSRQAGGTHMAASLASCNASFGVPGAVSLGSFAGGTSLSVGGATLSVPSHNALANSGITPMSMWHSTAASSLSCSQQASSLLSRPPTGGVSVVIGSGSQRLALPPPAPPPATSTTMQLPRGVAVAPRIAQTFHYNGPLAVTEGGDVIVLQPDRLRPLSSSFPATTWYDATHTPPRSVGGAAAVVET